MLYGQEGREPRLHQSEPQTKRSKKARDAKRAATQQHSSPVSDGTSESDMPSSNDATADPKHDHGANEANTGEGPHHDQPSAARTVVSWILNRVDVARWLKVGIHAHMNTHEQSSPPRPALLRPIATLLCSLLLCAAVPMDPSWTGADCARPRRRKRARPRQ